MRIRHTIAAAALAALALTACSSSSDDTDAKASSTPSVDYSAAEKAAGIPAEPDSAQRAAVLAGLKAISPGLVGDEDEAIENARNQCSTISGGGNADLTAKGRFSTSEHEVTDEEAAAINRVLKTSLCPS